MKYTKKIRKFIVMAVVWLIIFSCEKEGEENKPVPKQPVLPVVITNPEVKNGVLNVLEFKPAAMSDRHMIQMAVDYADSTDAVHTVFVPDGTYQIAAAEEEEGMKGVKIRGEMHFEMADNAVLKAIPNDARNYSIIRVSTVADVKISGGRIVGERYEHFGTNGGEWGHGIDVRQCRRVVIENVHVSNCWGDGIYFGGSYNTDITVDNVICDNNRRQGMSIVRGDGLVVKNSTFSNTNGTPPECGLDLEPNENQTVTNVYIVGCVFENNASAGLALYAMGNLSRILVESCVMNNNTRSGVNIGQPNAALNNPRISEIEIRDVEIKGESERGLVLRKGVQDIKYSDINVTGYISKGLDVEVSARKIDFAGCRFTTDKPEAIGLSLTNSHEFSFTNCVVQGGKQGALLEDASSITIQQTAFSNLSNKAFRISRSNDNVIDSVTVKSVSRDNIEVINSRNNQIINCIFTGGDFIEKGQYSFVVFKIQSSTNTISNNTIKSGSGSNHAKYGIHFASGTNSNTALGNQIDSGAYTEGAIMDDGNNIIG